MLCILCGSNAERCFEEGGKLWEQAGGLGAGRSGHHKVRKWAGQCWCCFSACPVFGLTCITINEEALFLQVELCTLRGDLEVWGVVFQSHHLHQCWCWWEGQVVSLRVAAWCLLRVPQVEACTAAGAFVCGRC